MEPKLRSLYICYLSLGDPLVRTQVVAYLEGLARNGHVIHLLTFEPELDDAQRRSLRLDLERRGLAWHSLRYHKRPSLPATVFDVFAGAALAAGLVRRHRLDAVHARGQVPAAMALMARRLTGARLIFDIRGLLADEYVDAGSWRRGGLPYRLTEAVQRAAIRRSDGIVMLTERVRRHLFGEPQPPGTHVIPCCADLERMTPNCETTDQLRRRLGLEGRPVIAYIGKLSGRYMPDELVELFAVARRLRPGMALLVLTQDDPAPLRQGLARAGIEEADFRITSSEPADVGGYLSVAHFGVFLLRRGISEIAASPTKIGEYLGAGLPVVSVPGVGDTDALLADGPVGVLLESLTEAGYEKTVAEALALAEEPGIAERCRRAARANFSLQEVGIPRYDRLYRQVAAGARTSLRGP